MNKKYYITLSYEPLCVSCKYARMRTDICGMYCTKGFVKDGKCEMYKEYLTEDEDEDQ